MTLSLFRFDTPSARAWVLAQMGAARLTLPRIPGLEFWKLCGSGTREGFTPLPNTAVWAILSVWSDRAAASLALASAAPFAAWRARSAADWTLFLTATSTRGQWSGRAPFRAAATGPGAAPGPVASLTRATIRPSRAFAFWRRQPAIGRAIGADPRVLFKIGIGEVPLLRQVTFSVWPDAASMAAFARTEDGPHAQAIAAVRKGDWFREELYARFRIEAESGAWPGVPVLCPGVAA